MNKIKLEIIAINEDVISTSALATAPTTSLCSHLTANHIDVVNLTPYPGGEPTPFADKYNYNGHGLFANGFIYDNNPDRNTYVNNDNVNELGWYYWNGTKYIKCEDQSNEAHPISFD